jgi:dihydroorotase
VVAPGFIDLHAHGQDPFSQGLQARDGVTTALELEAGVFPVASWYKSKKGKSVINYGASVGHIPARIRLKHNIDVGHILTNPKMKEVVHLSAWAREELSDDELSTIKVLLKQGLDEGGLGIGYGVQYTPAAARDEIFELFDFAAKQGVLNIVHTRHSGALEPESATDSVQEVITNAVATGASLHLCHLPSTGLSETSFLLNLIDRAAAKGVDVTTEVYPYTTLATVIGAATWDDGWQKRLAGSFGDLEWSPTGERLTKETFDKYRKEQPGQIVYGHLMEKSMVDELIRHPKVIVASDGMPFLNGKAHPRGAGTYARVLGHYVRENNTLSLMAAIKKISLLPAQRLESWVPAMKTKGRLQLGSDADISIFDANTVVDKATFSAPTTPSFGITHVLVNGQIIVENSELVENFYPGMPVKKPIAKASN